MHLKRRPIPFALLALSCAGLAAAFLAAVTGPASGKTAAAPAAAAPAIAVTAGKPSEFRFTLSKAPLPTGTLVFDVTNRGKLTHTFEVCTHASTSVAANTCTGKTTKLLKPGQSTTLKVTLAKDGTYEYLSTVKGQAAGGMKGQLVVIPTIGVTAGSPSELQFKLSKSAQLPVGPIAFRVTNRGTQPHDFKICTRSTLTSAANACAGKTTGALKPGASAVLVVTLKKGTYEFLSSVTGQAAGGMKGQIAVATALTPSPGTTTPPPPATTVTTPPPPAGKPPATETLIGDPAAGAGVFASAGCGSCHTLAAAGSTGTIGPSLDSLAHQLTQALIVNQVTNGGQTMPAFGNMLSQTQINDVAAYVYKSTHA